MKLKTTLYLTHRWVGIFMCLLFAMWFFSGVVMMYVGYPELTVEEQYAGRSEINPALVTISPEGLNEITQAGPTTNSLVLTNIASRPVYLLNQYGFSWRAMYADSGEWVAEISPQHAVESARIFYRNQHTNEPIAVHFQQTLEMDQWTISSSLSAHRPLHLIAIGDTADTHLYVSSRTGQVVLDTTRKERVWNWLGSNLHWIYPLQLRKYSGVWVNTIIVLSLIGLVSVFTGAVIGLTRLRLRHPYRGKNITPYRGIAKYHHILGLVSLIFLTTFMFSGLMSMGPWGIFDSGTSFTQQINRYQTPQDSSRSAAVFSTANEIRRLLEQKANQQTKQITWHRLGGESYIAMHDSQDDVRTTSSMTRALGLEQQIKNNVAQLIPTSEILVRQRLNEYDAYYYSHHDQFRPLPVLRVKFADPASTWFHIDIATGQVIGRVTSRNRVQRWIYSGLHSLDFSVLINNRPFWDIVVISLCGLGLAFSITSVVGAWVRIRKKG
ncbi:MAG: hypothetical protein HOM55_08940 [Proteobacteria bacterium]|jgi:uncharacterized iron-regulated membrane protein|nr:hypothetical protein [Pseudomonadota bacterium]